MCVCKDTHTYTHMQSAPVKETWRASDRLRKTLLFFWFVLSTCLVLSSRLSLPLLFFFFLICFASFSPTAEKGAKRSG